MKGTYNQNDNGAYCTACIIKSIPIWKSYLKATFLSFDFLSNCTCKSRAARSGGTKGLYCFIRQLRSDGSDGPACQQPSLRSQGNLPSTCHNDLQLSPLSVKGHSKKKWDRRGLFGLAPSACSGVWVSWELGLRWGLRELQVGRGPPISSVQV